MRVRKSDEDDDRHPPKDAEKPTVGERDRAGEDDMEGGAVDGGDPIDPSADNASPPKRDIDPLRSRKKANPSPRGLPSQPV